MCLNIPFLLSTMVPAIPPEIWLRVAQFIPSSVLRNLYSVNRIFLDLALNERYSDISFNVLWTPTTIKKLKHFKLPHIAHRVQRLTLPSDWLQSNLYLYLSSIERITLGMEIAWCLPFDLGRFIDRTVRITSKLKKCNTLMERTVVKFANLSSLVIVEGFGTSSLIQPSQLLMNACTAYPSNLRTLSLIANSPNFKALFPSNASELTSLEEVTLTFSPLFSQNADTEVASTFFQAIASTLTTLNITSDEPSQLLQSFLRRGGKAAFPKLTNFSLSHKGSSAEPNSDLMRILNQHAETLKHLRLQYASQLLYDPAPLLSPVLPHLETLNILRLESHWNCQGLASREGLDVVRAYVQHSSTLTSLSLAHCPFTLRDLGILLDLLGRGLSENVKGGGLKSLTVLDMLAEKLLQLEKLKVVFIHLRSEDVPSESKRLRLNDLTQEDVESFLLEMKMRSYSGWRLRSFGFDRIAPDMAMSILMPLTLCIPHLVEIDGPFVIRREPGNAWEWASLRENQGC